MILVLILIAVVVFFIYKSKKNSENTTEQKEENRLLKQAKKEFSNVVKNTKERSAAEKQKKLNSIFYRNPKEFVLFDDDNQTISFAKGTFPYSEIMGYTMYVDTQDKKVKGAVGAIAGGMLIGPVGAVVGGLARRGVDKSKFKRAGVKIKIAGATYDIQTSKSSDKNTTGKNIDRSKSIGLAIDDAKMISQKLERILN